MIIQSFFSLDNPTHGQFSSGRKRCLMCNKWIVLRWINGILLTLLIVINNWAFRELWKLWFGPIWSISQRVCYHRNVFCRSCFSSVVRLSEKRSIDISSKILLRKNQLNYVCWIISNGSLCFRVYLLLMDDLSFFTFTQ